MSPLLRGRLNLPRSFLRVLTCEGGRHLWGRLSLLRGTLRLGVGGRAPRQQLAVSLGAVGRLGRGFTDHQRGCLRRRVCQLVDLPQHWAGGIMLCMRHETLVGTCGSNSELHAKW